MSRANRQRSLTQRTLWKVAARIALVVIVATIVSYWHVRSGLEQQALEQLGKYVEERRARESNIFVLATDHLQAFSRTYRERLATAEPVQTQFRFDALFERRDDGTIRLRSREYRARGLTGFIGRHVEVDGDLRRRLVVAYDVLAQYGPAWQNRFTNLYVVTPENAALMYWPGQPWALEASDWEVAGKLGLVLPADNDVMVIGGIAGTRAAAGWSNLYFDYGVNDWMVSATEPVAVDGRHLLSVGHDILLNELFERTLTSDIAGTYNVIFRDDGRLIAHPRFMEAIQAQGGALAIQDTRDDHLQRVFTLASGGSDGPVVVENQADHEFLAVTRLVGPDWLLVTVFPEAIINARALDTAKLILILGGAALILEIAILYLVLERQVARPLTGLIGATRQLAVGRFDAKLATDRDDEIGSLARSFGTMAAEIEAREKALSERSRRLAEVNRRLQLELEERERAEKEIARQREALHQSEKLNALGSLLAGVAHELNNPLSVVVGRSMMLEDDLEGTSHKDAVGKVRAAAERCAKIVKTFLAIARQQAPSRTPVQIGRVVDLALEVIGYSLHSGGVTVVKNIPPDLPEVMADADQVTQVFCNLLINAKQAMEEVEERRILEITADYDAATRQLRITVADSGPGIPEEVMPRIFEPFFTTKPAGAGTGIGLSVSHGIVLAHGGDITVTRSRLGGAEFIIVLPVEAVTVASDVEDRVATDQPHAQPCRILVVDDEAEVAETLKEILMAGGRRQVEVAEGGRMALAKLADDHFDLVVTDLVMPDLDGPALYREIKAKYPALAASIVFVTGDTLSHAARTFLDEADRPVIEKPFTPQEVRQVVDACLEQQADRE